MGGLARRRPVLTYFLLTFAISWAGALLVAAPALLRGHALSKQGGILMFPVMLLGPLLCGLALSRVVDGPGAVRRLCSRMRPDHVPARWYMLLALPPILIVGVLLALSRFVSAQFMPGLFWHGIFFGLPAGFLEEIGWTGYAFPHMMRKGHALRSAMLLGLLWGLWHLPVIDYLGAATPHGTYLLPFFLAFIAALAGLRAIICWAHVNTGSLLLAQLLHATSTGSLVAFSPVGVRASGEAIWYLGYAAALWIVVAVIVSTRGRRLTAGRDGVPL